MAYGSRIIFVLKLAYCMSQLVIFAGWYSTQSSKLGEFTWPFLKIDWEGDVINETEAEGEERVLITERVVVEPATLNESVEPTSTSKTLNNFNVKED